MTTTKEEQAADWLELFDLCDQQSREILATLVSEERIPPRTVTVKHKSLQACKLFVHSVSSLVSPDFSLFPRFV